MPAREEPSWDEGPPTYHRIQKLNCLQLTTEERQWLGKLMSTDQVKASDLAKYYSIPRKWLNKLHKKVRDDHAICNTQGKGRPSLLSDKSLDLLLAFYMRNIKLDVQPRKNLKKNVKIYMMTNVWS